MSMNLSELRRLAGEVGGSAEERLSEWLAVMRKRNVLAYVALGIGAFAAGIAIGILTAPYTGAASRQRLRERLRERASEASHQAGDFITRRAAQMRERARSRIGSGRP